MPLFGESSFDDTKNTSILQINKSLESNKILKNHLLYGYPSWTEAIKSHHLFSRTVVVSLIRVNRFLLIKIPGTQSYLQICNC